MFGGVEISGEVSQFLVMSLYATEILLFGIFVFALFKKHIALSRHQLIGLGSVALAFALSFLFALDPIFSLAQCIHLVSAGFLFVLLVQPWVNWTYAISSFALGLLLPILLGIFQMLFGFSPASSWLGLASRDAMRPGDAVLFPEGARILRAYGSFSHPNIFGGVLALATILFWIIRNAWKEKRIYFYGIFSVLIAGLLLTASQSAWFALLAGCGIFGVVWMVKKQHASLWMGVSGILLALLIGFFAFSETQSTSERLAQYATWPDAMQGGWTVGHGIGSYPLALEDALPGQTVWEYQPIHNTVLLLLSDIGLVGVGLLVIGIIFLFQKKKLSIAWAPLIALCPILLLDHYLLTFWSGLTLVAIVGAFAHSYHS